MKSRVLPLGLLLCAGTSLLTSADRKQPLSEQQQIVHVANRLGYGPRPGQIDQIRRIGIRAYIEQQLYPERIADPVADGKLAALKSLALRDVDELTRAYPVVAPQGARAQSRGPRMEEGEKPLPPFDPAAARAFAASADREIDAPGDGRSFRQMTRTQKPGEYEIGKARLLRAVYSERQLLEGMVDFWFNHFNVGRSSEASLQDYEEHAIRPHALGKFEDLLKATAQHPAMLFYLDNWRSSAPLEVIQQRLNASIQPALSGSQRRLWRQTAGSVREYKGLNENYARELMELHTLGVDGGYTQQDVIEVARCFTGWTVTEWDESGTRRPDKFIFSPLLHENGEKVVLGQTIPSGGMEEGMQVLAMLAHHPSTARFISMKVARRFIADEPPADVVAAGRDAFLKTRGDIREVLRAILTHPKFLSQQYHQAKFKKPLELVFSSLRAMDADIAFPPTPRRRMGQAANIGLETYLLEMGEGLYQRRTPDGYPDYAAAWINSNALLKRMEFVNVLASGQLPGITPNLEAARQLVRELRLPQPDPAQLEQIRVRMAQARQGKPASGAGQGQMMMMDSSSAQKMPAETIPPEAIAVAYALGSPQFQKR